MNLKFGEVKLSIESPEDVWVVSQLIEPGDFISGVTLRKVQATEKATERKRVFLKIQVEKVEFTESSCRATGKIVDGPEDVPRGNYHTFSIEPSDSVTIQKDHWFSYQLDRIKEAERKKAKILICAFDREDAIFAILTPSGYSVLSKLHGSVQKKGYQDSVTSNFFESVIKSLKEYDSRFGLDHIIMASPAFWKDEFMKVLKDPEIKRKVTTAACNSIGTAAIEEVLRREEISMVLKEDRVMRETKLVESLIQSIATNGAFAYGFVDVKNAADAGAVETLLVSDSLIKKLREDGDFQKLDDIMKSVDDKKGNVVLISGKHNAGKQLEGMGGLAALLRYRMNY